MRICANCGAEIPEGYKFCSKCGTPVPPEEPAGEVETPVTDAETPAEEAVAPAAAEDSTVEEAAAPAAAEEATVAEAAAPAAAEDAPATEAAAPASGAETPEENAEPADSTNTDEEGKGKRPPKMRWYKFIICAGLFVAAILFLVLAALSATGYMYFNNRETVYRMYPGMQALNILMAAFYVIMAFMAIVVRIRLAHYRKNGPRMYIKWLWAVLIGWISYEAICCMIAGRLVIYLTAFPIRTFAIWTGAPVLVMILYILFNMFYFHRRKRRELFVK